MDFYLFPDGHAQGFDNPTPEQIAGATKIPAEQFAQIATTPVLTLAQAQASQNAVLYSAYIAAIAQPVSITTQGGVTKSYDADPVAISNVQNMLATWTPTGAVPSDFYWVAADNTRVTFTLADLQALAKALGSQGWAMFQQLQTLKAQVSAATTVAAAQAVAWTNP